jgi:hypothetical protein
MIAHVLRVTVVALALVPAAAGASAVRPPVALTAVPARLTLQGSAQAAVRIRNSGTTRVVLDVTRAGFALDVRGRPKIARRGGARSAATWLVLRPRHLALRPGGSGSLVIESQVPSDAEPGDHDALVLLVSRPRADARVAVRMRLGIVIVVRVPGRVERRLRLGPLRVARSGRLRMLELVVANRGNVTESIERGRALVSLAKDGRRFGTLGAASRRFRPRTSGILQFRYRGARHGWVTAGVVISGEPGKPGRSVVRRRYRIRL